MARFAGKSRMHFHKCEDAVLIVVFNILKALLRQRVNSGSNSITLSVSDDDFDTLLDFLDEMSFAYMHPRSTSARFSMLAENSIC